MIKINHVNRTGFFQIISILLDKNIKMIFIPTLKILNIILLNDSCHDILKNIYDDSIRRNLIKFLKSSKTYIVEICLSLIYNFISEDYYYDKFMTYEII